MVGLCRCCASLKKPDLLVTIQNESDEICQKLEKCCQLFIRVRDSLPKVVCHECLECLDNSYKFYVKVNEAQETLEAFYPQTLPKDDIEVPVQIDANISEKSLVESTSLEKEELKDQEATSEEKCPRLKSDAALDNAQNSVEHSFILIDNTDLSQNVLGHEKEIPVANVDGNEKVTKAVAIAPREEGRSQKRKNCPTKRLLYKKIQKRTNNAAVSPSKLLETHPFSNEDNKYLEEVYTLLGMTKDDISDESAQVLAREVVEVHGDKEEVRVEKQHKNNDVERYILTAEGVFEKEHSDKDIKFQKNAAEKELTEQPTNEALRIISVEEVSDHLTNEKDILKEVCKISIFCLLKN